MFIVAIFCSFGDGWCTGVGKTKDLGDFVEAFTDSIISSSTDDFKFLMRWHCDNLCVTARNNERDQGEFWGRGLYFLRGLLMI